MREYLFRGKSKKTQEWIEGNYCEKIDPTKEEPTFWAALIHDKALSAVEVFPESVGQFIGLLDTTKQRIFEGDLVVKDGFVYKVAWNNLHACWGLFNELGQSTKDILCDIGDRKGNLPKYWMDSTLIIIGKYYDNPELLTQ